MRLGSTGGCPDELASSIVLSAKTDMHYRESVNRSIIKGGNKECADRKIRAQKCCTQGIEGIEKKTLPL
jgi:hypothetical protein